MTTSPYIPDHIRNMRSDRLYHVRESLIVVMRRYVPTMYLKREDYMTCRQCSDNIKLIDYELHRRSMLIKQPFRKTWKPQFDSKVRPR